MNVFENYKEKKNTIGKTNQKEYENVRASKLNVKYRWKIFLNVKYTFFVKRITKQYNTQVIHIKR